MCGICRMVVMLRTMLRTMRSIIRTLGDTEFEMQRRLSQSYRKRQNGGGWRTLSYFFTQVNLTCCNIVLIFSWYYCYLSYDVFCILVGGLSSADWSVRSLGGVCLIPTADGTAATNSSTGVILSGRQSRVLENRDLCRIVASYIPKTGYSWLHRL